MTANLYPISYYTLFSRKSWVLPITIDTYSHKCWWITKKSSRKIPSDFNILELGIPWVFTWMLCCLSHSRSYHVVFFQRFCIHELFFQGNFYSIFTLSSKNFVMDKLFVHPYFAKFWRKKRVDEQSVHLTLKYFEHEKGGQTDCPHHFVQILRPF